MKKTIFYLMLSLISSVVIAQPQMKQKKVCNTMDNGAEFCTVFNVPIMPDKKTEEEINAELEKASELKFTTKNNLPMESNQAKELPKWTINNVEGNALKEKAKEEKKPNNLNKIEKKPIVKIEKKKSDEAKQEVKEVKAVKETKVNQEAVSDFTQYLKVIKSLDN